MATWLSALSSSNPDIVFNIAEGFPGSVAREAVFPALCEQLQLPYTGPAPTELLMTHNKALTKQLLKPHGVKMAWGEVLANMKDFERLRQNTQIPFPLIVKLNSEGSSMGMNANCIVNSLEELENQLRFVWSKFEGNILVEQYIPGRDISMTFVEGIGICGPVEYICPGSSIYDFRLKTVDNHTIDVVKPTDLPDAVLSQLKSVSDIIVKVLDINSYCRIDYRLGEDGELYFLEVNGQVCFHPRGAFVLGAEQAGYNFDQTVHHIIEFAVNNRKRPSKAGIIKI